MKAQDLKKSILQYAMQGKLVEQDSNDEPASELLKRIRAEKEQLIKDGKIKKEKPLPPITQDENPYELPQGWEWCYLNNITTQIHYGYTASAIQRGEVKLVRITDIQYDQIKWDNVPYCDISEENKNKYLLQNNDILIARTGGTIGKTYLVKNIKDPAVFASYLIRAIPSLYINSEYLKLFMSSPLYWEQLKNFSMGTGQPNVNGQSLNKLKIPIPPLSEQKRIVEKLEEILPLVEEYGKNEEILSEMNQKLPKQIRQSILQYAVQGKLVEQNPQNEPAIELLKRIKAEKEKLIKEGKIKKEKPLPPITKDEIPYELPQGWEWARLGNLSVVNGGYAFKSSEYKNVGIRVVRISDFNELGFVNHNIVRYDYNNKLDDYLLEEKNIILCMTGGTVGKSLFIKNLEEPMVTNQRVATIKILGVIEDYINYSILSPLTQQVITESKNSTNDNISIDTIKNFLIPLSPLSEQKRIVAKVEELLNLVNKLENK